MQLINTFRFLASSKILNKKYSTVVNILRYPVLDWIRTPLGQRIRIRESQNGTHSRKKKVSFLEDLDSLLSSTVKFSSFYWHKRPAKSESDQPKIYPDGSIIKVKKLIPSYRRPNGLIILSFCYSETPRVLFRYL